MKCLGVYKRKVINENGNLEITFEIDNYYSKREAEGLQKDVKYNLDIKEVKRQRSLQSNNLFWALCGELAKVMNDDNDEWDIYCNAIENASTNFEYVGCTPQAFDMLKKSFRVVKLIEEREKMNIYKVFVGSSQFNQEEMNRIIDYVLDLAAKNNLNTPYWRELLKGK